MSADLHLLFDFRLGRVFLAGWDVWTLMGYSLGGEMHEVCGKSTKLLLQIPDRF
jgi:hypothetical protein